MKKETFVLHAWLKDVAPSDDLCRWYHRDIEQWPEFRHRYVAELQAHPDV
jgi:uncharacterized protein YeaO (DUF488 family)